MRKFRLISDPKKKHYACGIVQDSIYLGESFIESHDSRPPFKIQDLADKYHEDWQEVTEPKPKPLHKDTDLGYFALEVMKSMIQSPVIKTSNDATFESFVSHSLSLAKELIKQLNNEK